MRSVTNKNEIIRFLGAEEVAKKRKITYNVPGVKTVVISENIAFSNTV